MNPPRPWRALLRRAVPTADRDVVVEELDLLYQMKAELGGRRGADAWYRREAIAFLLSHSFRGHRRIVRPLSVEERLLSHLADGGADLLVMGAYAHSRLRQLVLGGVTQHILSHMTTPVLLSH